MKPAHDNHEWLSLEDGEDSTTWIIDTAFMLSNYHCIYGQGCPSIEPTPDPTGTLGCCTHGAHFIDSDDRKRVMKYAQLLDDSEWQNRKLALDRGGPVKKKKKGDWVTRKVDDACIFLNRDDFEGGPGCALHLGALNRGERPLDWKPTVCWQVPIRLDVHEDDYGYETVLVRAWERRDWGPGGDEFHWWCTEEEVAYSATSPVYETAKEELVELMGLEVYERMSQQLHQRRRETAVSLTSSRA